MLMTTACYSCSFAFVLDSQSNAKNVSQASWGLLKEVVDSFVLLKVRFGLEYIFTASRKAVSAAVVI